jgi:hypothetical protein
MLERGVNSCVVYSLLLCNVSIWFFKIYLLFVTSGPQHTTTNTVVVTYMSTANSLTILVLTAVLFAPHACWLPRHNSPYPDNKYSLYALRNVTFGIKSASNDNLNTVLQTATLYTTFCRLIRSAGGCTEWRNVSCAPISRHSRVYR